VIRMIVIPVLIIGSGLALLVLTHKHLESSATDLQRHDLSVPEREVVQVRIDIVPEVVAPKDSQ
jgi:hypothetical protein